MSIPGSTLACPLENYTNDGTLTGTFACVNPTIAAEPSANGTCQAGYVPRRLNNVSSPRCVKTVSMNCPAGTTLFQVVKSGGQREARCIAPSTPLREATATSPCTSSETLIVQLTPEGGIAYPPVARCFTSSTTASTTTPAGTSSSTTTTATTVPAGNYNELNEQYLRQASEYEGLITTALNSNDTTKLPTIRAKAEQIQTTLNQMIESLTFLKKETPDISVQRSVLLEKLRQIQRDYNGMIANTDDLETLRRIRQQEGESGRLLLGQYLLFFLALAALVIVALFVFGRQKNASTPSMAPTPAMSPTLM